MKVNKYFWRILFQLFLATQLLCLCRGQVWQTISQYFYDIPKADQASFDSDRANWEQTGDYGKQVSGFPDNGVYLYLGQLKVSNSAMLRVNNIIPHTQLSITFLYQASGVPFTINLFVTTDSTVQNFSLTSVNGNDQAFNINTAQTYPHTADHVEILITGSGYSSDASVVNNQLFSFRRFVLKINVCHPSCASCNGSLINNCLSCYSNSFSLQSGMCLCSSSSYMIINNPCTSIPCSSCAPCHANCLTCFQSGTQGCLSCSPDKYFYNNQCFIQCQPGTYQDELNKICGDCFPGCATCTGPGNQQCQSCTQPASGKVYLDVDQCVNTCPIGKYPDDGQLKCINCDSTCYQCDSGSPTSCTDCKNPYFYLIASKTCVKICPDQFYANTANQQCNNCDQHCGNCVNSPTNCTSCGPTVVNNQQYLQGNVCVQAAQCNTSTFADNVSFTCKPCHPSCYNCSGSLIDQCTQCDISKNNYLQDGKTCVQTCKPGTYKDNSTPANPVCSLCDGSCLTCSTSGPTNCLSCPPSNYLQYIPISGPTGKCVIQCDSHYYHDSNSICQQCHTTCGECTGNLLNQCKTCTGMNNLTNQNTCVITCPDGFYGDSNICKSCNLTNCKTCITSDSNCTSCNNSLYLNDNTCVASCPPDRYTSNTDMKCYKCFANCLTCSGIAYNQCITCQPTKKYFAKNSLDNYGQCTDDCSTLSLIRFDGPIYQDSIPQQFLCLAICPPYYFKDTSNPSSPTCTRCDSTCLNCSDTTKTGCTKCYSPLYLLNGSCDFCPNGMYGTVQPSGDRVCQSCNTKCQACFGPAIDNCTSCPAKQYLTASNSCVTDCPRNTYAYNNKCIQTCPIGLYGQDYPKSICTNCDNSCAVCFNQGNNNCNSCKPSFFLYGTSCLSTCVDGTWPNPVSSTVLEPVCSPCDSSCQTCVGPQTTDCTSCRTGRYLFNNQCVQKCPDSLFGQQKNSLNKCVPSCDSDQFQNVVSNTCQICSSECNGCVGPTFKFCLTCATGFIRFQDMCVSSCPDGFWMNNQTKTCDPCSDQCIKCQQDQTHVCLKCQIGYFLYEGACISKCPDLLQPNIEKQICEACPNKTYTLYDSKKQQIQCINCHYSCSSCQGPNQNQCTLCEATRGETGSLPEQGYCFCQSNYIDKLEETCYQKDQVINFAYGSQTLSFFISTIASGIVGIFGNPTMLFSFIEVCQQLSYLQYMNTTYPYSFDDFSRKFYGYNINNLIVNPLSKVNLGGTQSSQSSQSGQRTLIQEIIDISQQNQSNNAYLNDQKASDKFYFNDKTSSFLFNSFTILIIVVFFWLVALIFRFCRYVYRKVHYKSTDDQIANKKKKFTVGNKISAALTVGLPFIIFQITSLEFILYSLLQYQNMNDNTLFNFISFCVCIVGTIYFLLMVYYIYYVLNIMKKHRKQNYYSKWSFLWHQVSFQESKMKRNFFLLLILKKFFICIFIVFLQIRLEFQVLGIFALNALQTGYMLFLNPYQERFYRYVSTITYTLMTAIQGCILIYSLTLNTNTQVNSIIAAEILIAVLMLFFCGVCIIELFRNIPIIFKMIKKIFQNKIENQADQQQRMKKVQMKDYEKSYKNELIQNSVVNPLENVGSEDEEVVEEELGPKHLKNSSEEDDEDNEDDDESDDSSENKNKGDKSEDGDDEDEEERNKKKFNSSDIPLTQFMLNQRRSLSRSGSMQADRSSQILQQSSSLGNFGLKNNGNNYSIKFRLPRAESQLEYQITNQKFTEVQKNINQNQSLKDNTKTELQPEINTFESKKKLKMKGIKQSGNLINSLKVLQQSDGFLRNNQIQQQQQTPQIQNSLKKLPKVNEKKNKMQGLLKGLNLGQDKKKSNEYDETPMF
ncbi:transmembrane protein, putative (macronuclear) [Tetrahymena thermophila SB210]|uniref:Transmembrane protein, putative n=1 Tax=Tetrahymena thermophila (strain SB210) TaxID=312017 RepID=I7LVW1_TETTS|nr:transmembrane protein, putative [Tetrahymena thermophila SB210]EAS00213.3 transmembrane protein, putative [Tetrahymena thermophila SB210]|eukprot:XP_001020458.3 transmembrane protein, putative [Tetrahymena thermophila SB210]